jgi:copper chaperone
MMKTLKISGMTCGNCRKHVAEAIASVPGVSNVQVSLETGIATFDLGGANTQQVLEAIEEEGYQAQEF